MIDTSIHRSVFKKTANDLTADGKYAKIKYMPKISELEQVLQDVYNSIILVERVRVALPPHWEHPRLLIMENSNYGPIAVAEIKFDLDTPDIRVDPTIEVMECVFADQGEVESTLRHEIGHQVDLQRGDNHEHGVGYKAILHELYGNDHDFYYNGSAAVEKRRKELGDRQ